MKKLGFKNLLRRAPGLIAVTALLFAACNNSFLSPASTPDGTGTAPGTGRVRVNVQTEGLADLGSAGPARTVYPTRPAFHYVYTFTKVGGGTWQEPTSDGNGVFTLETGSWNLTVDAYPDASHVAVADLAATGSTGVGSSSAAFTVSQGNTTSDITIFLEPFKSGGNGTLTWKITYPSGATLLSPNITWLDLNAASPASPVTLTGTPDGLGDTPGTKTNTSTYTSGVPTDQPAAGQYLFTAFYTLGEKKAGKNEVVHIYQNLPTHVAFTFVESDFTKDFTDETINTTYIDYEAEKLKGLAAGVYSFNGEAVTVPEGGYPIPETWMTGTPDNLSIVKKGDGATTLDSPPQTLTIKARPDAPTVGVSGIVKGGAGKLTGVSSAMQYTKFADKDIESSWTPINGDTVLGIDAGNYVVRYAAVTTGNEADKQFKSFASASIPVGHAVGKVDSGSGVTERLWDDDHASLIDGYDDEYDPATMTASVTVSRLDPKVNGTLQKEFSALSSELSGRQWYENGEPKGTANANTYTFDYTLKNLGTHYLVLTATKGAGADAASYSTTINITVTAGYYVSGTITAAEGGSPVAGASVQLKKSGGATQGDPVLTNVNGFYTIPDVPTGTGYTIEVSKGADTGAINNVDVSTASVTEKDLALGMPSISGTITTGSSTAVDGASVQLMKDGVPQGPAVLTGGNGAYTIPNVPKGDGYTIVVSKDGYTTGTIGAPGTGFAVNASMSGQNLTLVATYSISGKITTGSSTNVVSASVQLMKNSVPQGPAVLTDGTGAYTIINVPKETGNVYTIQVSKAGYTTGTITVGAVTANVINKDLTLVASITGTITKNGSPVAGATVQLMKGSVAQGPAVQTDTNGFYTIPNVTIGTGYTIVVSKGADTGTIGIPGTGFAVNANVIGKDLTL
jgi:hypothetical protein